MTFTIFLAQVAGGVISGSLVLLSDVMHMLADFTGLMIALIAILIGRSTATHRATYNHRRVEVFTALINATIVSAISVMIVVRALGRIGEQVPLDTGVMLIVAMVGLAANAISALILGRRQHESLNMRGVYLRVLSDLLGSVGDHRCPDHPVHQPAARRHHRLVVHRRDGAAETTAPDGRLPRGADEPHPEEHRRPRRRSNTARPARVASVRDLHTWNTVGTESLATSRLALEDMGHAGCGILDAAQACLQNFGIEHSTIQLEQDNHIHNEVVC